MEWTQSFSNISSQYVAWKRNFLRFIKNADLSSLRVVMFRGSAAPQHMLDGFNSLSKNGIVGNGYGMTENCGGIVVNVTGRKYLIGALMSNVDAKVISEDGVSLGIGNDGEICVKSKFPFLGYFEDENQIRSILVIKYRHRK